MLNKIILLAVIATVVCARRSRLGHLETEHNDGHENHDAAGHNETKPDKEYENDHHDKDHDEYETKPEKDYDTDHHDNDHDETKPEKEYENDHHDKDHDETKPEKEYENDHHDNDHDGYATKPDMEHEDGHHEYASTPAPHYDSCFSRMERCTNSHYRRNQFEERSWNMYNDCVMRINDYNNPCEWTEQQRLNQLLNEIQEKLYMMHEPYAAGSEVVCVSAVAMVTSLCAYFLSR